MVNHPWLCSLAGICSDSIDRFDHWITCNEAHLTHFIVTLCFMGIARGLVYILTGGSPVSLVRVFAENKGFAFLGQGTIAGVFPWRRLFYSNCDHS